jgi:CPA2 family monovalent cation:H+ antiporter-2
MSEILVLLISAVTVVSFFRFFRASPIHGYLMAGLLIGPHSFAFISNIHTVQVLGEFGIVFLLFTIGLKMPFQRLHVLRRYVFGLGSLQILLTSLAIGALAYSSGVSAEGSVVIGSALSLSSTAVAMQVLVERGEFAQRYGRVSFAVLLAQDLAVIVLLILQTKLVNHSSTLLQDIVLAGAKVFGVFVAIILTGRLILCPLYRVIARFDNPELFVAFTLLVILLTSLITEAFGLSMELGAFLAGLLLSETEYRHQVEADIQPFHGLLLGLFFMSVGMSIDILFVISKWHTILVIISGMLVVKGILLFLLCRLFQLHKTSALRVALLLAPGGEFVFVLLLPAVHFSLLTQDIAQLLYAVVVVSMALTPFLAMLGKAITERWMEQESEASIQASFNEVDDLRNHVIIAGFGRVGKLVAKLLTEQMIPFVIIDNNMNRVSEGKARGLPIFYGDARRANVMRTLGAAKARVALISLHNNKAAVQATLMLRRQFPSIEIAVRLRDNEYEEKLKQAGAKVIMPEHLEPSLRLASAVLESLGCPPQEVRQVIDKFRKSYLSAPLVQDDEKALAKTLSSVL